MKRARIWEHLGRADEHIRKGQAHVKNQEERVKELTSDGHQAKNAEATLKCFQELLGSMKKHRDLVLEELKKNSDSRVRENNARSRLSSCGSDQAVPGAIP
jgi:hypothetical protein